MTSVAYDLEQILEPNVYVVFDQYKILREKELLFGSTAFGRWLVQPSIWAMVTQYSFWPNPMWPGQDLQIAKNIWNQWEFLVLWPPKPRLYDSKFMFPPLNSLYWNSGGFGMRAFKPHTFPEGKWNAYKLRLILSNLTIGMVSRSVFKPNSELRNLKALIKWSTSLPGPKCLLGLPSWKNSIC